MSDYVQDLMAEVRSKSPGEIEFHHVVKEMAESLGPVLERHPQYRQARILERLIEPERKITFRVCWLDYAGRVQVSRGCRVQMNSALGPYHGPLRFHPSASCSILKSLAFDQVFKNALTMLPLGAGAGGADFDPKGKSDEETMRFCHAFMDELHRHLGPNTDVLTRDIGVAGREIGYLFGRYRKLRNEYTGVVTGKGLGWGGSAMRLEAAGYGAVYFAAEMLATRGESLDGKTCLVSGSGNVAQFTMEKLLELGAKVLTFSDSSGYIYDPNGLDREKLDWLMELKNLRRGRIREFAQKFRSAEYMPSGTGGLDENPQWDHKASCAFPCATQNEISVRDARRLLQNGVYLVSEGANMPTAPEAVQLFVERGILFGPGKAANAGGVAVSGLETAQNAIRCPWTRTELDRRLGEIMKSIHAACLEAAESFGTPGNYVDGANIAGFFRVADAMIDQGVI